MRQMSDIAQNRGGSQPFAKAQQYLEGTLGPEKATTLNTYTAMKCRMKNVSSSGNNGAIISNGAIMSQKAQKCIGTNNLCQADSHAVDGNNDVMESCEENDATWNVGDQIVDAAANHGETDCSNNMITSDYRWSSYALLWTCVSSMV